MKRKLSVLILLSSIVLLSMACSNPLMEFLASEAVPEEQPVLGATIVVETPAADLAATALAEAVRTPPAATPAQPQNNNNPAKNHRLNEQVPNPGSGNALNVTVGFPPAEQRTNLPTVVLVPGGIADSSAFLGRNELMDQLNLAGYLVVVFDADGRGDSPGEENYNGSIHQDGLAAVIRYAAARPESDGRVILVSQSYGVTMASGTLSRYPELPVRFYIDWEGPADRFDTTFNCQPNGRINWGACDDLEFWQDREALRFISSIQVPYQRLQSEKDHAQNDNEHALNMIYAAVQGSAAWVRLNQDAPNQIYDFEAPPMMIPEQEAQPLNAMIVNYINELSQIFP